MTALSRRGLFVAGGTGLAGVAIAGCGEEDEPREEGRDPELLAAALAAEEGLLTATDSTPGPLGPGGPDLLNAIREASSKRQDELGSLASETATGTAESAEAESDPSGDEGDRLIAAFESAIAAYREGAGLLSTTELRGTALEFLIQCAAEQAAVRSVLGEDPAPRAFVTGLDPEPFQAIDQPDQDE
jgi:hypothetical protein